MRYMPTFLWPVRGSRVITAGSVMNGPASPGQHVCTGRRPRSTSSPVSTISCDTPRFTSFGRESAIDFSVLRPRTFAASPSGGCISRMSPSFSAMSSSCSTPNARHMRLSVPNWLTSSGIALPAGCSKSSAGPPARTVRSTISVISRCGSTSAATRTSSPSRSRSAIHSRRSRVGIGAQSIEVRVYGGASRRGARRPVACARCRARTAGHGARRAAGARRAVARVPPDRAGRGTPPRRPSRSRGAPRASSCPPA